MNKKFMVVALMAALSTVGYAVNANDVNKRVDVLQEQQKEIDRIQDTHISNVSQRLEGLKNDVLNMDTALKQENIAQDGRLDNIESTLTQKVDKAEQAEIDASQQSEIAGLAGQIGNLGNDILQNKEDQAAIDKSQNETINGLNQQIGDLANNKADKAEVEDLKDQVEKNEQAIQGNTQQIEDLHKQDAALQEQIDRNEQAIQGNTQQIVDLNNSKLDKEQYENDKLAQEKRDEDQDGKIDNVSNRLESFKDQVNSDNAAQNDLIANNTQDIDDLKTENKNQQAAIDKNTADIETNKNNIAANKDAIAANKAEIETNKENIAKNEAAIKQETQDRINADNEIKEQVGKFQDQMNKYDGRLSGLEKKVDHLDDKMNKGLSLMAAMNAVDFQNVQTGEMAIGAGVGHYGNAQSVALGVAYSPVEDLTVNAKYSVTAGDVDSFALGAGATYKFKVGR